jgi:membrane-bound lytic murein transglycosylase B
MRRGEGALAPPPPQPSWRLPIRVQRSRLTVAREASVCRSISFSPSAAARPSSRAGAALKQSNAALFASIQQRFGVPPGPLLAIWGMETGFGRSRGNQNTLSAVATLAYDCRRTAYFTEQLYATLTLIDRGILSAGTRGSMHGEIGHTQFLPKSILNYGTGGNLDIAANALSSTANFLRGHGWRAGAGYQPGQTNFGAIQAWNAAPVYQRAIALIGQQIDGGEDTSARP